MKKRVLKLIQSVNLKHLIILAVIVILGATAAAVLSPGTYNVKDYGLVDDSVTDNSTKFNQMLATLPNGATIYFPGGGKGYGFGSTINLNRNFKFIGDGQEPYRFFTLQSTPLKGSTTLYFTSSSADFISIKNTPGVYEYTSFVMEDLSIVNVATSQPTAGNGVIIDSVTQHFTMNRVTVKKFFNDVNITGGMFGYINNCNIVAPIHVGLILDNKVQPDAGGFGITNTNIVSGLISGLHSIGVLIRGGGGCYFSGCFWNAQSNIVPADEFEYDIYSDFLSGATSDYHVTNCFFENFQFTAIYLRNVSGGVVQSFQLDNLEIASVNSTGTALSAIDISNIAHVSIGNVRFTNFGAAIAHPAMTFDSVASLRLGYFDVSDYTSQDAVTANVTDISRTLMSKDILNGNAFTFGAAPSGVNMTMYNGSTTSGGAQITLYPGAGTNTTALLNMISRGNGGAQLVISGSDRVFDPNNFHYAILTSNGTSSYDMFTGNVGTAPAVPLRLGTPSHTGQLQLLTNGNASFSGSISSVVGVGATGLVNGNYFISTGAANIEGFRLYKDATPTIGWDIGLSKPGGTTGNNIIISSFNGTTWTDQYTVTTTAVQPDVTITNDLGTSSLAWRDVYYNHLVSKNTSIPTTTALGTNVASATVTAGGTDASCQVTVVTSGGAVSGTIFTLTYNRTWGTTPHGVMVSCVGNTVTSAAVPINGDGSSATTAVFTGIITSPGTYTYNITTTQ